jgi:hypothetical protein
MKTRLVLIILALFLSAKSNGQDLSQYSFPGNGIIMYPNPARDNVHILLPVITDRKVAVNVLDFNGQIKLSWLFESGGNELNIDISTLPDGLYAVHVIQPGIDIQKVKLLKR